MNNWLICTQQHYGGKVLDLDKEIAYIEMSYDYIYIFHTDETDLHYHAILIDIPDSITKNDLLRFFPHSDIKLQASSNNFAFNYLLHNTSKAKKLGKHLYDISDIHTNVDIDYFCSIRKDKRKDNEDKLQELIDSILNGNYSSMLSIVKDYGTLALRFYNSLSSLLSEVNFHVFE